MILVFFILLLIPHSSQKCELDVLFMIDASGSVSEEFKDEIKFVEDIGRLLQIQDEGQHVGLLVYSDSEIRVVDFKSGQIKNYQDLLTILRQEGAKYDHQGETYTGHFLEKAYKMVTGRDDAHVRDTVFFLLSDGKYTPACLPNAPCLHYTPPPGFTTQDEFKRYEKTKGLHKLQELQDAGKVTKFCIGLTRDGPKEEEKITKKFWTKTSPKKGVCRDKDKIVAGDIYEAEERILDQIAEELPCVIEPPTTTTSTSTTTTTTTTTTTVRVTGCELDLLLIVDASNSIYDVHKTFVMHAKDISDAMMRFINPGYTSLSVMRFSYRERTEISFDFSDSLAARSRGQSHLKHFLTRKFNEEKQTHVGGPTYIDYALNMASELFEDKVRGARPGPVPKAKQVAVMITDGGYVGWANKSDVKREADRLKSLGVELYLVGIYKTVKPPGRSVIGGQPAMDYFPFLDYMSHFAKKDQIFTNRPAQKAQGHQNFQVLVRKLVNYAKRCR